jgi:pyruvate formate lyase activating enzyme
MGNILKIQRFSTHDGPGIRTTVFMKGCNLRCAWCHNPESIDNESSIYWSGDICEHCGACAFVCPEKAIGAGRLSFDKSRCRLCGTCVKACSVNALEMIGEHMKPESVLKIVERDKKYYENSGGGVTVSGGEPMLQFEFVRELFLRCKEKGINTALDTAGNVKQEAFETVLPVTDLFLYDLKVFDNELHAKYTGAGNSQIKNNLIHLLERGVSVEMRIPVIGGVNDNEENMKSTNEMLGQYIRKIKIKLLPYHSMGIGKCKFAVRERPSIIFDTPDQERLSKLAECFDCDVECESRREPWKIV